MNERFAVIDIETTGGMFKRDKIIEIGIVLLENGHIIEKFDTLINPGRSIPHNITRITGIDTDMVAESPRFFEVAKKIVEMTEGAVFVAHNVRFDYSFIKRAFQELGYTYSRRQLCTHTLTRKTIPGLASYGLGSLIHHFGISVEKRHRALDDAIAAANVLELILKEKNNFKTAHQLINYGVKESQLPPNITIERLHELPEECGVYYLHNNNGDVVYVGKSINIRKRIMEHFADTSEKSSKLHHSVRDLSYEITGSELIALLHESMEIKKLRPFLNKALRRKHYHYALVLDREPEFYSLALKRLPIQEHWEVIRAFPKLRFARSSLKILVQEHLLCQSHTSLQNTEGPCYYHSIGTCLGACTDEEGPETYNQRVLEAVERFRRLHDKDFLLVEEGRNPEEKAAIWVESGQLKGYGYVPADRPLTQETLDVFLNMNAEQQDSQAIISNYMHKSKRFEIIDL